MGGSGIVGTHGARTYLNSPDRQSARVGMLTYLVRATRKAHFRMWPSTPLGKRKRKRKRKRLR